MEIVSRTRVVIVNRAVSNKMKIEINKTLQTLENCCTAMETAPEMQWLPTKRIKSFGCGRLRMVIKDYLGSFVLESLKIFHKSEVVLIAPHNVTIIEQGKDKTVVKS